jgi:hypothetical protein
MGKNEGQTTFFTMSRRRQNYAGITELAWDYLNDCAEDDRPHGWEFYMLENNEFDLSTGYRTEDIWARYKDAILAEWVRTYPGTRPWCWWKFDSGLPRVYRPDHQRPFEIVEDTRSQEFRTWQVDRDSENKRWLTAEEREALWPGFLLNQRTWLAERRLLERGE